MVRSEPPFAAAVGCHQAGDFRQAAARYRDILRHQPDHAGALHLLGVACQQEGDLLEAAACIRRAIAIDGSKAVYHNNLGVVLRGQGLLSEATAAYRRALEINARYPDAMSNLATVLHEQGQHNEALALFREVLRLQPAHIDALFNLGNLCRDMGCTSEAIDCYQKAAAVQPRRADVHNNLGNALLADRRYAEASTSYERAIDLNPSFAEAHLNLGVAHAAQDHLDEAGTCFARASRLRPEKPLWRLRATVLCPAIFQNVAELDRYRERLLGELEDHQDAAKGNDWRDLDVDGVVPSFHLAHHGRDNRPLLEKFAALYESCFPRRDPPRGTGKPRIGFLVTRYHEGGFLRSMGGIIERLDPLRFQPVVLCSQGALETCRRGIRRADVEWVPFADRLGTAAERVAAARCDVLYHWQIGTDPLNYFLPLARLAPIQCTSWGSHGTTGMAAVDYCLSSDLIESPGAEQQYTERLERLKTLPTYERHHPSPVPGQRSDFGLPEMGHLYCCPQRIAKFHPDADALFSAILREDARGFLVVIESRTGPAAESLRRRFQRTLGSLSSRVIFVPAQSPEDFRRLLTLADLMVDPPHYSAGFTAYDAFSLGLPVVSLPDDFAVGRFALGCYHKMGLQRWIPSSAEAYVALAVSLGTAPDSRQEWRSEITDRSRGLFEDAEAVREYERFFEKALNEAVTTTESAAPGLVRSARITNRRKT